jgi:tight adherence protein C
VFAVANYESKTENEMLELYQEACEQGEMHNCYQAGLLLEKNKEKEEGKKLIKTACQSGSQPACEYLDPPEANGSSILFYASILLFGVSVLIITMMMFQDEGQYQAQEKLDQDKDLTKAQLASQGAILKYSRPFFKRYITPIVSSMKNKKKIREKYKRKLASSGLTQYLTPEDFFSFKLFLIIGFPIVFMAVRAFVEADWPLKLIPLVAFVGYFYPDIWIKSQVDQRQKEIMMGLPFSIDMLALSVEAGLDFMAAITKVVEKARPGPLRDEFETLIKEIKIGATRAEALRNMAWRVNLINVSSFCATLIAADSVGASIGPILKNLSGEIRQKRSADVEKAGATAATKILFPMLFLIVPAVFIIVMAPMIIGLVTGG